jgi:uncharacterized protein YbgA (DUF1722 family)/uncharacterized protein YbbK (DUF523 family)
MSEPLFDFPEKIPVGVSQCLLGEQVRYDGGHKLSPLCTDILAQRFDFVPVCPEMGIGLGAPREPIQLVGSLRDDAVRVLGRHNAKLDVTEKLERYGREKAAELGELCGYIFVPRSPSCGLTSVPVYDDQGHALGRRTSGVYAREFTAGHPLLPVEEEVRLRDPVIRANFLTRVYAWQRWRALAAGGMTLDRLRDFHARHKYLLLAQQPGAYRHLSRLVALAAQRPIEAAARDYLHVFMAALRVAASRRHHAAVLQQLAGGLEKILGAKERQEWAALITRYRQGRVPLDVPLTLLREQARRHPDAWLQRQVYLQPYPPELLRDLR